MDTIVFPMLTDKQQVNFGERSFTESESRKSILVVDDNENIRELLSVLFHEDGNICTAVNGLDALSKFAGNHFDIIVSDIEMPVMNGIELHKKVHHNYKGLFLFFSGTMNEKYLNYLEVHNLKLFSKPGDILALQSMIKSMSHAPVHIS